MDCGVESLGRVRNISYNRGSYKNTNVGRSDIPESFSDKFYSPRHSVCFRESNSSQLLGLKIHVNVARVVSPCAAV